MLEINKSDSYSVKFAIAFFCAFIFSLPVSIAGMEMASWTASALLIFAFVKRDISLTATGRTTLKRAIVWALPLALAISLSGVVNSQWPMSDRFHIFFEPRWLVFIFTFPALIEISLSRIFKLHVYFILFVSIISVYSIVQAFTGIDIFRSEPYLANSVSYYWRAKGFFSGTMTYSYVFSGLFFILFGWAIYVRPPKEKYIYYFGLLVLFVSLIFTFTRGMWIGVFVGMVFSILLVNKKWVLPIGLLFLLLLIFASTFSPIFKTRISSLVDYHSNYSNVGRVYLWKAYAEIIKDNIIFGVGLGQGYNLLDGLFEKLNAPVRIVSHAHNNLLSILAGTGIIGLFGYLLFMGRLFYLAMKIWFVTHLSKSERALCLGSVSAMICFHVGGMTESNFLDAEVFFLFLIVSSGIVVLQTRNFKYLES